MRQSSNLTPRRECVCKILKGRSKFWYMQAAVPVAVSPNARKCKVTSRTLNSLARWGRIPGIAVFAEAWRKQLHDIFPEPSVSYPQFLKRKLSSWHPAYVVAFEWKLFIRGVVGFLQGINCTPREDVHWRTLSRCYLRDYETKASPTASRAQKGTLLMSCTLKGGNVTALTYLALTQAEERRRQASVNLYHQN